MEKAIIPQATACQWLFPYSHVIMNKKGVNPMSMHFVTSTLVDSVGYHNGNLYIQFKNGNLYEYFNVPFRHYQGILAAESVGKYYGKYIRGQYPRKKIDYNL